MDLQGKKIIVTGGAGFIGSHIVDALLEAGAEVAVVDNLSTGRIENISHVLDKIEFIQADITDTERMKQCFAGAFAVVHQAAVPSVPRSVENPMMTNQANSVGTLSVFTAAKEAEVDRVIYASSSSVYGDTPILPKVETMQPNPLSPYAAQKFSGELNARIFHNIFGLKTIGLRYFNIFGPRQNPNSEYAAVIPKFITKIKRGEQPVIYGDGNHTRDFTFVRNAVEANLRAVVADSGFGDVFNVATGNQVSLKTLVEKINSILGTSIEPEFVEAKKGDIKDSFADIGKAKKVLGYEVIVNFDDGLRQTAESL